VFFFSVLLPCSVSCSNVTGWSSRLKRDTIIAFGFSHVCCEPVCLTACLSSCLPATLSARLHVWYKYAERYTHTYLVSGVALQSCLDLEYNKPGWKTSARGRKSGGEEEWSGVEQVLLFNLSQSQMLVYHSGAGGHKAMQGGGGWKWRGGERGVYIRGQVISRTSDCGLMDVKSFYPSIYCYPLW